MPADPQPPAPPAVEAMLRDAARQRRTEFDAAGPGAATMPGPMRTRLHAELTRQFADAPPEQSTRGWFSRWWPALAGVAGAVAAVVLLVVAGQQPPSTVPVASSTSAPAPATPAKEEPSPTPAAATAPPVAPAAPVVVNLPSERQIAAGTLAKDKDAASPMKKLQPVSEPIRTQTFTQNLLPLAKVAAAPRGPGFALRPAPAAAPAANARRRDAAASAASTSAPAVPAPASLLENFRFEQRGENVRVVDADGSIYVGQVEPADALKKETAARALTSQRANADDFRSKAGETSQNSPAENFRFRATGDNRTLRKPVVFEGEYSAQQQLPEGPAAAAGGKAATASQPAPTPAEAQIRGRVRVLDNDRVSPRDTEVDARAVGPATPE